MTTPQSNPSTILPKEKNYMETFFDTLKVTTEQVLSATAQFRLAQVDGHPTGEFLSKLAGSTAGHVDQLASHLYSRLSKTPLTDTQTKPLKKSQILKVPKNVDQLKEAQLALNKACLAHATIRGRWSEDDIRIHHFIASLRQLQASAKSRTLIYFLTCVQEAKAARLANTPTGKTISVKYLVR
jgi:hypothetical protein